MENAIELQSYYFAAIRLSQSTLKDDGSARAICYFYNLENLIHVGHRS